MRSPGGIPAAKEAAVARQTLSGTPEARVLEALDRNAPTSFYWSLTLLATLSGFLFGYDTANIAEYAPKGRRGSLAMLQQWMITVGILVVYVVALVIFRLSPAGAATSDWRLILGLGAVSALIGLAALCVLAVVFVRVWLPETKGHSVDEIVALFGEHAPAGTRES
jgi:MFS family permease